MVKLTIDNQAVTAEEGTTILRAAEQAGIIIPRLCEFEHLTPFGGCRMCMVEIEGIPTLQTSCTTKVAEGMVVDTQNEKVKAAREFVLSLLFSERNHFCMYCTVTDGDCELQNAAYHEEMTHWPMEPNWSPFPVDASPTWFYVDHNRCILCRRCVRACWDLVGNHTLHVQERGHDAMLRADNNLPLGESSCISCGTCLQVCPTGALVDRNSAYKGKKSDADVTESICVQCSVGCGINVLTHGNQLFRVESRWDGPVNHGLLCEYGRFKAPFDTRKRIEMPMVRKNGSLVPVTWEEAIQTAAEHLKPLIGKNGSGVAALVSTKLPAETLATFTSLFKDQLGGSMVTSIEEGMTVTDESAVADRKALVADLDAADFVLAVGIDLFTSHQVAGFQIRRHLLDGMQIALIDPAENKMATQAMDHLKAPAGSDSALLSAILAALDGDRAKVDELLADTGIASERIAAVATLLAEAGSPVIAFGKGIARKQAAEIVKLIAELASKVDAKVFTPKGQSNSVVAQALGLDIVFQTEGREAVFLDLGDDHVSERLLEKAADAPYVIVMSSYDSPLSEKADVILPVVTWLEQEGHYVNLEGRVQQAYKSLEAPESVRQNAAVLKAIAKEIGVEVEDEWQMKVGEFAKIVA
ncbi:MAG: molybdopterin-dependent oxidoreductase [Anaerolineales bacterium]|nr:molybdopterin-dependent oxidoreductase [Anaerolineales bacterium]